MLASQVGKKVVDDGTVRVNPRGSVRDTTSGAVGGLKYVPLKAAYSGAKKAGLTMPESAQYRRRFGSLVVPFGIQK